MNRWNHVLPTQLPAADPSGVRPSVLLVMPLYRSTAAASSITRMISVIALRGIRAIRSVSSAGTPTGATTTRRSGGLRLKSMNRLRVNPMIRLIPKQGRESSGTFFLMTT